jgi:hypothetical protein
MSKADEIRAGAGLVRKRHEDGAPLTRAARPVRDKPVRHTVDLTPVQHRALAQWRTSAADDLGRIRVTSQQVLQALVTRLLADDDLTEKIRADLDQQREL